MDSLKIMSALAEPNRIQIVELLRTGQLTVGEIAEQLTLRQPQASKHLRVLLEAGIVDVTTYGNRRIYKLREEAFTTLDDWLQRYRDIWEERFDNLDGYLKQLQEDKGK